MIRKGIVPVFVQTSKLSYQAIEANTNTCIYLINKCLFNNYFIKNLCSVINKRTESNKCDESTVESREKSSKMKLISQMNFQSHEDALPFYELPIETILCIYKVTKNDERNGYCKNRLYFLASRLKCSPSLVSEQLAKRTFIYSLSFEWLQNSLTVLLDMDVKSDRIIRDLWVLKYHHETIQTRLQRIRDMGIKTLLPWMVRCTPNVLDRYLGLIQETKDILGDMSIQAYLASRLNISLERAEEILVKIPALQQIRAIKLKRFIDFLIEEGFQEEDIANKARIMLFSQKSVQQRINKLRNMGVKKINLTVLCKSNTEFEKYCLKKSINSGCEDFGKINK